MGREQVDDLRGLVRLHCNTCASRGEKSFTVLVRKSEIGRMIAGNAYRCECGSRYYEVVYS
jgi:hypothetical protein